MKPAPAPPDHLSEKSRALWADLVGDNVVSSGRLALFQIALEALDRADQSRRAVALAGMLVGGEEGKMSHPNPLLKVERDSMALFVRIWTELNLGYRQGVDGKRPM